MKNSFMKQLISTEYLIAAILVAVFFVTVGGFDWYWLPVTFLLFDISMAGYLFNPKAGAVIYNIGHSLIGPAVVIFLFILTGSSMLLFLALVWLFHIFVDRALGYGLKHTTGFHSTHLGEIKKRTSRL